MLLLGSAHRQRAQTRFVRDRPLRARRAVWCRAEQPNASSKPHAKPAAATHNASTAGSGSSSSESDSGSASEASRIADGEALENAVAELAASPFGLGAVPSQPLGNTGKPRPTSARADATTVDGESDEAEALLGASAFRRGAKESASAGASNATTPVPTSPTTDKTPAAAVAAAAARAVGEEPPKPPAKTPPPGAPKDAASERQAGTPSPSQRSTPSRRLLNLSGGSRPAGRPEYRPSSALSLARRRMIATYLPFKWQQEIRKRAEDIPEQQFNYLLSTLVIVSSALVGGLTAYAIWPFARSAVIFIFSADAVEARVLQELTFETQYLSAISLVTAILLGNTFAFSFDRQRQIIAEMSEEVFALELLLQELFIEISEPHLRWRVIKHIKRYIDDEIQARGIDSPFRVNGAIMGLFNALLTLKEEGKPIAKMIASVELLAQANSRRGALASALLPPLHWVMLASLALLLLSAFLLFDSDFSNPVAENRTIFAVLSAMLVSILQVLRDISTPDDGLYSVRDPMEMRLSYVRWQMDNILSDPAIKLSILGKEETDGDAEVSAVADGGKDDSQPSWMQDT